MKNFKFLGIILSFLMLSVTCAYAVHTKDVKPDKPGVSLHVPSAIDAQDCQLLAIDYVACGCDSPPLVQRDYAKPADYLLTLYWQYVRPNDISYTSRPGHYRYLNGEQEALPQKNQC